MVDNNTLKLMEEATASLDELHREWLSKNDASFYRTHDIYTSNIQEYFDHRIIFSCGISDMERYKELFVQDCDAVRKHLSELKSGSRGKGVYAILENCVSRDEYMAHRVAVIAELNYKAQLLRYIKLAIGKKKQNKVKRTAWKDRNSAREQRLMSFDSIFVSVAKEVLSKEVFKVILDESHRRQDANKGTLGG